MTENLDQFHPKWPLPPPGDTILDILEERGWTQSEFADRTGYTTKYVNQLIRGKVAITEDVAFRLKQVFGGSVEFWLSREAKYCEVMTRGRKQMLRGESESSLRKKTPKSFL